MHENGELKRDLGLWSAVAIVVGTVIGSGIFLVPKTMILRVGTPEMVFLIFVVGGLLSLFGALSYAELAAAMPETGGEYAYLRAAYGPMWAFLYGWMQTWVGKSGSVATLATAFFYYLANFWPAAEMVLYTVPLPIGPGGGPLEIRYGQIFAMCLILGLGVLNYFGVKLGGQVQVLVTVIKVGLIAAIIVIGLTMSYAPGTAQPAVQAAGGSAGFFAALVAALWAYDGWNNLNMVAAEVKNPRRNLPLALVWGTLAVAAIYLLANAAYFRVLTGPEVAASDRVAAEMMRRILGPGGAAAVSVAAMISIFAALNGSILTGSRVPFAMARDRQFFRPFAQIHPEYHTPAFSILALSAWSAILVLSGRYEQLFTYVIFASWIMYGLTTAAVIVLRKKQPDMPRPYRTIGYPVVPCLFVLAAALLVISTLRDSPRESLMGLAIIAVGLPFYLHWNRPGSR